MLSIKTKSNLRSPSLASQTRLQTRFKGAGNVNFTDDVYISTSKSARSERVITLIYVFSESITTHSCFLVSLSLP